MSCIYLLHTENVSAKPQCQPGTLNPGFNLGQLKPEAMNPSLNLFKTLNPQPSTMQTLGSWKTFRADDRAAGDIRICRGRPPWTTVSPVDKASAHVLGHDCKT